MQYYTITGATTSWLSNETWLKYNRVPVNYYHTERSIPQRRKYSNACIMAEDRWSPGLYGSLRQACLERAYLGSRNHSFFLFLQNKKGQCNALFCHRDSLPKRNRFRSSMISFERVNVCNFRCRQCFST